VLTKVFQFGYVVAMFLNVAFLVLACCLPDLSPPPASRVIPTARDMRMSLMTGPCRAYRIWCRQTHFTRAIVIAVSLGQSALSSAAAWLVNFMLEEYSFADSAVGLFVLVFFLLSAIVVGIFTPLVRPWTAMCLGAFCAPIGVTMMYLGPGGSGAKWFVFIAIAPMLPGAVKAPACLTVYWAQQPPEERHELVALFKMLSGLGKAFGSITGGAAATFWLRQKENGASMLQLFRPQWVTTLIMLGSAFSCLYAYRVRSQDTLMWDTKAARVKETQ
jgi:hypothetical protein